MRPAFGVLADRRRADEHADFDRQPGALADLDDRRDVGDGRARGAVGAHLQLRRRRSRAPGARRRATTCGPAPGRPMSAVSMPSSSIRCRISIFCSMVGVRTDGDCSPSRSVSSSSITARRLGRRADLVPVVDQGFEHLPVWPRGRPIGGGRGAGGRDRRPATPPSGRAAARDHRPEAVIDGERRQPLLRA